MDKTVTTIAVVGGVALFGYMLFTMAQTSAKAKAAANRPPAANTTGTSLWGSLLPVVGSVTNNLIDESFASSRSSSGY